MQRSSITPKQMAFLASLRAGSRPVSDCQDAITVGALLRFRLVSWKDTPGSGNGRTGTTSTFRLTPAGNRLLRARDAGAGAP